MGSDGSLNSKNEYQYICNEVWNDKGFWVKEEERKMIYIEITASLILTIIALDDVRLIVKGRGSGVPFSITLAVIAWVML